MALIMKITALRKLSVLMIAADNWRVPLLQKGPNYINASFVNVSPYIIKLTLHDHSSLKMLL